MSESPAVDRIADYIRTDISRFPEEQIELDTPLISSGLVDSFSLAKLITFLDGEFRIRIDPRKVRPRNFETVRKILDVVKTFGGDPTTPPA